MELEYNKRVFKNHVSYKAHIKWCQDRIRSISPRIYEILMINNKKEDEK